MGTGPQPGSAAATPPGSPDCGAAVGDSGQIPPGSGRPPSAGPRIIVAATGGTLAEVTAGDFLELLDAEAPMSAAGPATTAPCRGGCCARPASSARARRPRWPQLHTIGQRTPAELIDRYQLSCRPVRDLLVDYLQERQPALDHTQPGHPRPSSSAGNFWADLERHHPGIGSLNLPPEVATAWKQRLRTTDHDARARQRRNPVAAAYLPATPCSPVRALYLDLACWAAEDPARWAPWAVPSPVSKADVNSRKEDRRRKSRMDARTRERLPVLPVLARSAGRAATPARPSSCRPPATPSPASRSPWPARPSPARRPQARQC